MLILITYVTYLILNSKKQNNTKLNGTCDYWFSFSLFRYYHQKIRLTTIKTISLATSLAS